MEGPLDGMSGGERETSDKSDHGGSGSQSKCLGDPGVGEAQACAFPEGDSGAHEQGGLRGSRK